MNCHDLGIKIDIPEGARQIVLAGNPNVGKSVFFNALTGMYVDVSNYPGTTLAISHGKYGSDVVVDTPGVYGISSFNDEERIARDIILSANLVLNVVDAVHLERDLFLTQQIIDTGVPVIVALNMVDEAKKHGRAIDVDKLSEILGVPVIPTVATTKIGLDQVKEKLFSAQKGNISEELKAVLAEVEGSCCFQGEALLILEGDPIVSERNGVKPGSHREEIYQKRRQRVNEIVYQVVSETNQGTRLSVKVGRWMLRPITGIPLLLLVLFGMYEFIGVFIAQTVVNFTEKTIMNNYYEPTVIHFFARFLDVKSALGQILVGQFGLFTMTVTYIIGLLLPLVVGFYFILALLEDSGYLPRIATLMDRLLTGIGLNGRAVIPIILGFGCVTMATITTRLLGSERERRIATFLLGLAIPCSAQMAVIAGLLAGKGIIYVLLYMFIIFAILVLSGTLLNQMLPGESTELLIDLPSVRLPRMENVFKKTITKSSHFLKEATPLFAGGALIISILDVSGLLLQMQNWLQPLTVGWLRLPKETATAFIMGFVRRDFGAAGLYKLHMTDIQTIVSLVTLTLFVPCIASTLVIFKERGRREGTIIWPVIIATAFIIGGIVAQLFYFFRNLPLLHQAVVIASIFILVIILITVVFKIKKRITIIRLK